MKAVLRIAQRDEMGYTQGVAFLRSACKQYERKGDFGRYYRDLELLEQAMVLHIWLRGVENGR